MGREAMTDRVMVRMTPVLGERVRKAAAASGTELSEWARAALASAADLQEAASQSTASGPRVLGASRSTTPGMCLHPLYARKRRPFDVYCRLCSTVLRVL